MEPFSALPPGLVRLAITYGSVQRLRNRNSPGHANPCGSIPGVPDPVSQSMRTARAQGALRIDSRIVDSGQKRGPCRVYLIAGGGEGGAAMKRIGFTLGSLSTPIPLLSFPMSLFLLFLSFAPAHASEGAPATAPPV